MVNEESQTSAEQSEPAAKNAAAIKSYLSGGLSPREQRKAEKQRRKRKSGKTLAGRQGIVIAVIAAVVVALIPVYFAVIRPLVNSGIEGSQGSSVKLVPEDGEALVDNGNGLVGMMPTVNEKDISELTISNESGEWSFFYYEEHERFYIKNYKDVIYDETTWTTVLYQFSRAVISSRAAAGAEIRYSDYGLAPEDSPAVCTIETKDGNVHKIYVGSATATGSGYYACYEYNGTRRDTVYIVNGTMGMCAELAMYDILYPIVTVGLGQENYVPEKFDIYHDGLPFLKIRLLSQEEIDQSETAKTSHVYTPDGMDYDTSSAYMTMLYSVLRSDIMGKRVVKAAPDGKSLTAADLAEFGIYVPGAFHAESSSSAASSGDQEDFYDPSKQPHMILSLTKEKFTQDLLFSEKTEDDTYFVYVMRYDIIVEMEASSMKFMEWDLKNFVDASIFLMSIHDVRDMTVDSTAIGDQYVAAGVPRVKETFRLTSKLSTAADGTEKFVLTNVTADSLGGASIPKPTDSKDDNITNFKQYYMVLLTIGVQLDVPADVLEKLDMDSPDVTITLHTVKNQERVLRFYFYNSRHAYYTLDGEGQFYVVYDELTKFLSDTVLVTEGRSVDWETSNNNSVQVDTSTGEASLKEPSGTGNETKPDEKKLPLYILVILITVAVVVVFGVGGFLLYAVAQKKKQSRSEEDEE